MAPIVAIVMPRLKQMQSSKNNKHSSFLVFFPAEFITAPNCDACLKFIHEAAQIADHSSGIESLSELPSLKDENWTWLLKMTELFII